MKSGFFLKYPCYYFFSFKAAGLNVLEVESELIVDITYLSQLLRRHSRNGTFKIKGELKGWTAAHYIAIEIKEDVKEEELIRILVKNEKDLKAVSIDGLTVLGEACEHRNRNLINYVLKTHSELLGVGTPYLRNSAKEY